MTEVGLRARSGWRRQLVAGLAVTGLLGAFCSVVYAWTAQASPATAAQTGQWGGLINWPTVAMHGAVLSDGNVLTFGDTSQGHTAYLWNPTTNAFTSVPDSVANPSCGGTNILPDGRVITVGGGGVDNSDDNTNVTGYQETNQTWAQLASNAYPTWYASTTVLPNGNLLRMGGVDGCQLCNPEVPEEFSPATNQWTTLSKNPTLLPFYPNIYVRPDGTVALTGASQVEEPLMIYNPTAETWTTSDPTVVDGGSSAMYDTGMVIKAGSNYGSTPVGNTAQSAATAYTTDLNQATPKWTQTGSMAYPRSFLNLTALPDGTVLATGGSTTKDSSNPSDGVLPVEDWNPATGQWTTWASMAVPRLYHSIAMLLPSGQVLVAGTGDLSGVTDELSAQVFSPPYLFDGARPTITSSPSVVQYGSTFQVSTPDAASIASVSLIRPAAVTHSFNESSRRVSLSFTESNGMLNVQAPASGGDAPPGPYMLFIVNKSGVPSVASWVNLPASYEEDTPPSAPTGLTATAASSSSLKLSWTASTDSIGVTGYTIFRNGSKVGTSTTPSYTDSGLSTNTTYTYTVSASNRAGMVSTASSPASGTPAPASGPPPPVTATYSGTIRLYKMGYCLDDRNNSSRNGAVVQIWRCNGRSNQQWQVMSDGTIRHNGLCLDAAGYGTANGTKVQLWACTGNGNQQWDTNGFRIHYDNPAANGEVLDDTGYGGNGTRQQIWTNNGTINQLWETY